jgi:hypothetical protein
MKKRGRKSAAELSVVAPSISIKQIPPPKYLTEKCAETWRMIMASRTARMINPEAYPLLVEYCRSIEQSNILALEIEQCDPHWLKGDDGLKRYDKLLSMQERLARLIASCAVKLRLTPSTRFHSETAGRIAGESHQGNKPWD